MATNSQKTYRMNQTISMSYTEIQADFSRKFRLKSPNKFSSMPMRDNRLETTSRNFAASSGRTHVFGHAAQRGDRWSGSDGAGFPGVAYRVVMLAIAGPVHSFRPWSRFDFVDP